MKSGLGFLIAAGAVSLALTGCEVYEDVPPPPPRGYVGYAPPPPVYGPGYVTATLPPGYRSRYYRGHRYYNHNNVYYRHYPRRGYVVVDRPVWW